MGNLPHLNIKTKKFGIYAKDGLFKFLNFYVGNANKNKWLADFKLKKKSDGKEVDYCC